MFDDDYVDNDFIDDGNINIYIFKLTDYGDSFKAN